MAKILIAEDEIQINDLKVIVYRIICGSRDYHRFL